jgi:hypothetical protein
MSTTPATAVVSWAEVARRGIELRVAGDRLRYRPRSMRSPDTAQRTVPRHRRHRRIDSAGRVTYYYLTKLGVTFFSPY